MKYVIETDNLLCREHGTTVCEVMEKMYAIGDSLDFIIDEFQRQFPNEITSQVLSVKYAKQITLDTCNAIDEFYIENGNAYLYIEVVAKEVAQFNDKEYLSDVSAEELKEHYQVGGKYSYYTKLGNTKYFFRFL